MIGDGPLQGRAAAGRERLGAASAGVAFSRNIGAATGTAVVAAVVFMAVVISGSLPACLRQFAGP